MCRSSGGHATLPNLLGGELVYVRRGLPESVFRSWAELACRINRQAVKSLEALKLLEPCVREVAADPQQIQPREIGQNGQATVSHAASPEHQAFERGELAKVCDSGIGDFQLRAAQLKPPESRQFCQAFEVLVVQGRARVKRERERFEPSQSANV